MSTHIKLLIHGISLAVLINSRESFRLSEKLYMLSKSYNYQNTLYDPSGCYIFGNCQEIIFIKKYDFIGFKKSYLYTMSIPKLYVTYVLIFKPLQNEEEK